MQKILSILFLLTIVFGCQNKVDKYTVVEKKASIFPDYTDITIPINIAPLNFDIQENGAKYFVEIIGEKSGKLSFMQKSSSIDIPISKWKDLLKENAGNSILIDIYVFNKKQWYKYQQIKNFVSTDSIDNHLVYRMVHATYLYWRKLGIYQRNLENFDEKPIFVNESNDYGCVNCHMFSKNNPNKMMIHFRINNPGTLVLKDGELKKYDTRTPYTMSAGVYPSWHPNGRHIAYSVVKLSPHVTTRPDKILDVADKSSDIIIFDTEKGMVTTSPKVSTRSRENLPTWSPDGKYLYFISAPEAPVGDVEKLLHSKYSLLRISFDVNSNTWGDVDTVLSAEKENMSITFPVISPNGKFLMFTASDYGYFTIFHKKSDIYLLNLETLKYRKLELNSNSTESYHSWSSNSKWVVFTSKRLDDTYSRPFISWVNDSGQTTKPFVIPQKDPVSYNSLLANFNRPELVSGEVNLDAIQVRELVLQKSEKVSFDKSVNVDALSGATWIKNAKK